MHQIDTKSLRARILLHPELGEDCVEDEAGAGFGVWVDVDGEFDAAGGLGGGVDMDAAVG